MKLKYLVIKGKFSSIYCYGIKNNNKLLVDAKGNPVTICTDDIDLTNATLCLDMNEYGFIDNST